MQRIETLPVLSDRHPEAHKGSFGHVLVVGGSMGMSGACCMAAYAAQRGGAGLVTMGIPECLSLMGELFRPSIMSRAFSSYDGCFARGAADEILNEAGLYDICAIGPGMGRSDGVSHTVHRLLRELDVPVVVDADGLNALAGHLDVLGARKGVSVLTPHPGEMARLMGGVGVKEVQKSREHLAADFAEQHHVIVVLKGYRTVVTDGEALYLNQTGNPGMATGGMGDVLTGLVAGFMTQGLDPFDAATLGVYVHGKAGDVASVQHGQVSLTPEDVLETLGSVIAKECR